MLMGLLLFVIYSHLNPQAGVAQDEIVIDDARLQELSAQFERVWQRAPTAQELDILIEAWLREEVLYREGLSLGLDQQDPEVRYRIARKMEFLGTSVQPNPPTEAALQTWLEQHPDDYRIPATYSFEQLHFAPSDSTAGSDGRIVETLESLRSGAAAPALAHTLSMLPRTMHHAPDFEVSRTFGRAFVNALETLPLGEWTGPVTSGMGVHLLRLDERSEARPAGLQEVLQMVERDYLQAQADELEEARYETMRARYDIRFESRH